jgi:pSer/pThr/pTyr-binding forkhead associated (FHA) protein
MALWHLEGSLDETKTIIKTPVTHFPFTIGRSISLDMVVLHSGISREHAEIYKKGSRLYIRDLDSSNGTFVNKHRISSDVLITHNTLIYFSHVVFKLIDLDFKPQADEHLTRIINIANVLKRKDKDPKTLSGSKSLASVSNKIIKKEKQAKSNDLAKVDTIDRTPESVLAPGPIIKASSDSRSAYIVPKYLANEKIFVQGGSEHSSRRLHNRREAHWPAQVTLKNQQIVQCMTKDFSEKGLALKSLINLQIGALIRVEIKSFYKGRNLQIIFIGIVKHSLITADGFLNGILIKQCSKDCSEFIKDFSNHKI